MLGGEHMNTRLIGAMAMTVLGAFAAAAPQPSVAGRPTAQKRPECPFACDASTLTTEQRKRHFEVLGPTLRSLKRGVRELPDGYEFEFPADPATVQLVMEWAAGERLCCPFFDIDLRMERDRGPLWLRLSGRKGTKEFIETEAAAWIQP